MTDYDKITKELSKIPKQVEKAQYAIEYSDWNAMEARLLILKDSIDKVLKVFYKETDS